MEKLRNGAANGETEIQRGQATCLTSTVTELGAEHWSRDYKIHVSSLCVRNSSTLCVQEKKQTNKQKNKAPRRL